MHYAFLLFPASGWLLTLIPHPSYWTPTPSLLSSFGDTAARTPPSSSAPSYLPSFISPPLAHIGSAPWSTLVPQHDPSVYSIHAVSTSGVLRPTSVRRYKMPLVLALLLLHPIPSHSEQSYEIQLSLMELGSSV